MATTLDRPPPLAERLVGADLIVVGTVRRLQRTLPAEGFDQPRTWGLFQVDIEEQWHRGPAVERCLMHVLSAHAPQDHGRDGDEPRWAVPVAEGATYLLLLTRDVAPHIDDDVYAPYFASAFPVEGDTVAVPRDAVDDHLREATSPADRAVSRDRLRAYVEDVLAERAERRRAAEDVLGEDLRRRPHPGVTEIAEDGGAEDSSGWNAGGGRPAAEGDGR